jgi:dTDP-4-amino-4,6-dideoxygalactose transaminase
MNNLQDIFLYSKKPFFDSIKSTSNLVKPSFDNFFQGVEYACNNNSLSSGNLIDQFEAELSQIHGTKYCISFCNGLWAMVLTIKSLALKGRSEVIMPAMTYRRLADIVAWLNLIPHFTDVNPTTLSCTAEDFERSINENTSLLLVAQPIVKVCDMESFERLGTKYGIPVFFDSVESGIGTSKGRKIGSFGDAEAFSMHASKLINGFEAGYITTNSEKLANNLKLLRDNGIDSKSGEIKELGLNAKLNEIHASMGLIGLHELEQQISKNVKRYNTYNDTIAKIKGLSVVKYDKTEKRGYKNILIKIEDEWPLSREETLKLMHSDNMLARPYYWPPLHKKETSYPTISGEIKYAEKISEKYILMPSGDFVSNNDIKKICNYLELIRKNAQEIKEKIAHECF